ncbi:hypothetical protein Tco_1455861 [Tanacetum coccineum]
MSETEPIPPTSSVTALRIPIIKKGEYDLWSMKMRQYIAITDHILWDIITNGNQTTTDPASPSVSAPKTSLAANARRNNEKALNILLSAIPDRHLLSFHDAVDARSLWKAIKARFGGNEASKKMQKNLLKQQFETFTIGSREELDSAYERFQHILSMLELHDATVSIEDANLKFLRSLPSVWHVVATMIRGQPGLDELDFDDLYNNLKVYEHELKGVSNSNSQNIAFLSTEVKGSTLKQSTAEPDSFILLVLSKHYVQEEDTADPFFDDIADKDAAATTEKEEKGECIYNIHWAEMDVDVITAWAQRLEAAAGQVFEVPVEFHRCYSVSHIVEDFVKRHSNYYMEPTEFEIQEMVNIGFRGSLLIKRLTIYMHHLRGSCILLFPIDDYKKGKKITGFATYYCGDMFKGS